MPTIIQSYVPTTGKIPQKITSPGVSVPTYAIDITETMADQDTSTAIIMSIAAIEGRDPLDLDPMFGDIETDSLNMLFNSPSNNLYVEFTTNGWNVQLHGSGEAIFERQISLSEASELNSEKSTA
ncbi:HalOD1 output domain-containing protein [Haloprofundus salinisoli]|uniref:HalOD1 output domain-containing protein n=1 Tax=Haloprofundus salinisoli TaxID=2876193 RepID=UPI001CC9A1CC|nr:HalOD1 output domain-containing protein [Haloprofundus salinisoli]